MAARAGIPPDVDDEPDPRFAQDREELFDPSCRVTDGEKSVRRDGASVLYQVILYPLDTLNVFPCGSGQNAGAGSR